MNHRDLICKLVAAHGWCRGAELGLGGGHLSRRLLQMYPGLKLIGVDHLARADRAERARALEAEYSPRFRVLGMLTSEAAARVDDASLDFIFIDAGHSYEAVYEDIELWHHKVHADGFILGHDYGHPKYPGVARAVDEWFGDHAWLLDHTVWMAQRSALPC